MRTVSSLIVIGAGALLFGIVEGQSFAAVNASSATHATSGKDEPTTITGTVLDAAGKPVRGAMIVLSNTDHSVARFTDAVGKYRIEGSGISDFQITASYFGFTEMTLKVPAGGTHIRDMRLKPGFDTLQMTSADVASFLPKNAETDWMKARCVGCHGLTQPERLRGADRETFSAVLTNMQLSYPLTALTEKDIEYGIALTVKYFGKDAPVPSAATVRRPPPRPGGIESDHLHRESSR